MATNNTYFMSVETLREGTVINDNVSAEVLEPFIIMAQNLHIEKLTGTNLYNKIVSDLTAGSITGDYKTLLDAYITPALLQWALYEALPFINYKFTNKSISTKDSDNSSSIDLSELQFLSGRIRDVAEIASQRVIDYLKDNEDLFTEYGTNGDDCSDILAVDSGFFTGIEFD